MFQTTFQPRGGVCICPAATCPCKNRWPEIPSIPLPRPTFPQPQWPAPPFGSVCGPYFPDRDLWIPGLTHRNPEWSGHQF